MSISLFVVGAMYFVTSAKTCTMMIEVSSEQWISQLFTIYRVLLLCCSMCCYTAVVAAATVLVLPAAVRHRVPEGQVCCCFIESDPSVLFLFIHTRFIFDGTPGQCCCVAFTASICLHPR